MIDKVIDEESNHSNSMSLSMSRISDQRKFKTHSILLLLYYNIDLLENCLELLKTAINRETERGTNDFSNLLKGILHYVFILLFMCINSCSVYYH